MHYEARGEGRPILIVHGFEMDHRLLLEPMERIFRNVPGWKRIYVDLPMMGRSAHVKVANGDAMLVALVETVLPGQRFALMGESYGGYLSRGICRRLSARVDGLFLLCPVVVPDNARRDLPAFEVRKRDDAFLATLDAPEKADFEAFHVVQTEATWKRFVAEVLPGLRTRNADACAAYQRAGYGFSFDVDAGPPLDKPTLVVTGKQDHVVGYRDAAKLADCYPQSTFAALDGAGHNLQYEQEAVMTALVVEWLRRL